MNPQATGTHVEGSPKPGAGPVRGIASVPRIALLRLEGDGMVGVPGIAMRLFGALARKGVSVILISQASSEHSICFGIAPESLAEARKGIEDEFSLERQAGIIEELVVEDDLAVVAVVGTEMRRRAGLAGKVFSVLGDHDISVRAIAQGSSELNISLVVAASEEKNAVRALHRACFSEEIRTVEIYLAGVGRVGQVFLEQLAAQRALIEERQRVRLRLVGVAGSKASLLEPPGLDPRKAVAALRSEPNGGGLQDVVDALGQSRRPDRIFIDCSASPSVAAAYDDVLAAGVAVVTANKVRLAGPGDDYAPLEAHIPQRLYFETTVGAGLPVLKTLQDLIATGDRLHKVEGFLSGTLTFLMDRLHAGKPFSEAVREAHELGFTEPDPREDLGGQDVGRKLLILARVAGRSLEPEDISVEPLLPNDPWKTLSLEEFWNRLPEVDEDFRRRCRLAEDEGRRLGFLAELSPEGARVSLQALPTDHPCAGVRGSDNLIAFSTERYRTTPLVVQGPGAGPEVTAAGVFADVFRAVREAFSAGILAGEADGSIHSTETTTAQAIAPPWGWAGPQGPGGTAS